MIIYGDPMNTDINGYLQEYIAGGFPKSSVRVREFIPSKVNPRDMVVQPYPHKIQEELLELKQKTYHSKPKLFHQSLLFEEDEEFYNDFLSSFTDVKSTLLETCLAMPCDLAICNKRDGEYIVDFIHLVFPNAWSANGFIGMTFQDFHSEVKLSNGKHVLPMNNKFPEHLARSGKVYERIGSFSLRDKPKFVDHPDLTSNEVDVFNAENIFIRFERQVIVSVPEKDAFLFFIFSHMVDLRAISDIFVDAMENCSPDSYSIFHFFDGDQDLKDHLKQYIMAA